MAPDDVLGATLAAAGAWVTLWVITFPIEVRDFLRWMLGRPSRTNDNTP